MEPECLLPCSQEPATLPILSQMNPVCFIPSCFKIHFNIIFHLQLGFPLLPKPCISFSYSPYVSPSPLNSPPPSISSPQLFSVIVKIVKLLFKRFSPVICHFLRLKPKHLPHSSWMKQSNLQFTCALDVLLCVKQRCSQSVAGVCSTVLSYQTITSEVTEQREMKLRCNRRSVFSTTPCCSSWFVLRAVYLHPTHYDVSKTDAPFRMSVARVTVSVCVLRLFGETDSIRKCAHTVF